MPAADWPVFEDPHHGLMLRRPPDWSVLSDGPDRTVIQNQSLQAELTIAFLDGDCAPAKEGLRARRLNYYLIREFTSVIGGLQTAVLEFRDTIADAQETHAFLPVERRCCYIRSRRPAGPRGLELESILENIISTLEFTNKRRA